MDKVLIVGERGYTHLGGSFLSAAPRLGLEPRFLDAGKAWEGPGLYRALRWRFGRVQTKLRDFSLSAVAACEAEKPRYLVATGFAPIRAEALSRIAALGVTRIIFVTDDPWNPAVSARWFFESLKKYDRVFTPRRANLADFKALGCASADRLFFGYSEEHFYPEEGLTEDEKRQYGADVVFVGGADKDRLPYVRAILRSGLSLSLFGAYWDKAAETRPFSRGIVGSDTLRKATAASKVSLCLVRRANRDGHVMRSFEIAASGGCLLAEDTEDHREIFGEEGRAALYFSSIPEMIEKIRRLLSDDAGRTRMSEAARRLMVEGRHTYGDRLAAMIGAEKKARIP